MSMRDVRSKSNQARGQERKSERRASGAELELLLLTRLLPACIELRVATHPPDDGMGTPLTLELWDLHESVSETRGIEMQ